MGQDKMENKMKNKRGQFFGIYIVFVTLFLCGAVFLVRFQQIGMGQNELISPRVVLDIVDGLEVFELREADLIERSCGGLDFGEADFDKKFRKKFLDGVEADEKMKAFIFDRLTVRGNDAGEVPGFFANVLYLERLTFVDGDKLYVGRDTVGKRNVFEPSDRSNNYFPIEFTFEFEKSYVVDGASCKIIEEGE
jgi:hypothetical protein